MEIFLNLEIGLNVKYNPDYLNNHGLCVALIRLVEFIWF